VIDADERTEMEARHAGEIAVRDAEVKLLKSQLEGATAAAMANSSAADYFKRRAESTESQLVAKDAEIERLESDPQCFREAVGEVASAIGYDGPWPPEDARDITRKLISDAESAESRVAELERELKEAREDTDLLDWLETHKRKPVDWWWLQSTDDFSYFKVGVAIQCTGGKGNTLRAVLRAARSASPCSKEKP
jgi:hypothetical protein